MTGPPHHTALAPKGRCKCLTLLAGDCFVATNAPRNDSIFC